MTFVSKSQPLTARRRAPASGQVPQRRPRQQSVQAWLRRRRSQARVILGGQDHHRVLAVHRDALRSQFSGLPHDLAEMRFGILKLPRRGRAMRGLRQPLGSARMSRGLPHCGAKICPDWVSRYTAAGSRTKKHHCRAHPSAINGRAAQLASSASGTRQAQASSLCHR